MTQKNIILCIDDDFDTIKTLEVMFKLEGFSLTSSTTLEKGLRYARQGNFNAIIMDYKLLDCTGAELCKEIREFDSMIPIIFFTASALARDREKCLEAGAQAYLVKPNDIDRITDIVMQLIELRKQDPMGVGNSHKGCFLR